MVRVRLAAARAAWPEKAATDRLILTQIRVGAQVSESLSSRALPKSRRGRAMEAQFTGRRPSYFIPVVWQFRSGPPSSKASSADSAQARSRIFRARQFRSAGPGPRAPGHPGWTPGARGRTPSQTSVSLPVQQG